MSQQIGMVLLRIMERKPIKVTFYQRKPRILGNYSFETYFDAVRNALPESIKSSVAISKYESNGFLKRLYNCLEAIFRQGDINHITGDVHFLNFFLSRKKNVLTVHDCGQLKLLKGIKFKLFKLFWFTLPAYKSNYITTISNATKEDLLTYIKFDPQKIKVIPVCVPSAFTKSENEFNSIKPRILQLGTATNKNIERLIASLENISCTLVIIGHVGSDIKNLAKEKGVELVSFERSLTQEEVIAEYKMADIVTLISTLEGFGMPIVEGNTVGRVVITGNTSSMPEVASNAAHLVDPFSIESMQSGFRKIIIDKAYRESLIERGYENSKRFSVDNIAAQYAEVYEGIKHCSNGF